ncbi:unnamed protein product [Owenia fusiformis]|uniref:EF-hand domain-containing protein n=1 Tax=Owenia fusiformis TaxID=6347 RepID=A0A8S4N348_OWEFU|nr:unnamed protein product [Owenia fusiformis]
MVKATVVLSCLTIFLNLILCSNGVFFTESRENDFPRLGKKRSQGNYGLFRTNDRENELPRIGARKGLYADRGDGEFNAFSKFDSNEDERVSLKEYQHQFEALKLLEQWLMDVLFRAWDKNGDGFLTRAEFDKRLKKIAREIKVIASL